MKFFNRTDLVLQALVVALLMLANVQLWLLMTSRHDVPVSFSCTAKPNISADDGSWDVSC